MTIKLREIFDKPVDRPIEGVIKADDEASLRLELEEYIITNEVEKQLNRFLDPYITYETANGVWISGFFGSGKSHLLKMLALVLENREIDGVPALDLFLDKATENEILRGDLKRAAAIPSKSILFNIDQKADVISKTQIDALLSVFQKVFDETCGYYGKQGYIAQFERHLDGRGKYAAFKESYRRIAGTPWERGREEAILEAPNIARAFAEASGSDDSSAEGILNRYRSDYKVSIEDFANQVKAYIDSQGAGFRLNFFVDEVGQYIADNLKLMTNLQTLAESLNTKCRGRAWIIVTAQQELKSIVGEMSKDQANDFTKIQARFKIRMPLTSANVDEVIQKRLLKKTDGGVGALSDLYHEQANNLRTLFDFSDSSIQFKNFRDRDHFIHSYPFIPYQYTLFQMALQNLSEHNAFEGRHSSVGERSMLGVFQEVAIRIADLDVGKFAAFDLMFDGIRSTLKSGVQQSVQIAERNLDNPFAVRVLKALFLVKYVRAFKPTVRNISILMLESFEEDLAALRKRVEEAVGLLERQTYIQRNGDLYEFLTDEEKDVEEEIKRVDVDTTEISRELEALMFDTIVKARKIRHETTGHDYSYARRVDDRLAGREYELSINVMTPFSEHAGNVDSVRVQNMARDELAVILRPDSRLVNDLLMYKRTEKYVRQNRAVADQPAKERIISDKGAQNQIRHRDLTTRLKTLTSEARLLIRGEELDVRAEDAQNRIMRSFQTLVDKVYVNLRMLRGAMYSEADVGKFLKEGEAGLFGNEAAGLTEAEQEILNLVQGNSRTGVRTTVKAVIERLERKPYGWPYAAIICNVASLCGRGKVEARSDADVLEGGALERALKNTQAQGNVVLEPQVEFTPAQVRHLKEFYTGFFDAQPSSGDGKAIARETAEGLQGVMTEIQELLARKDRYLFVPALEPVLDAVKAASGRPPAWYLTEFRLQQDRLSDLKEDVLDPIRKFMNGAQRAIYDEARAFLSDQKANLEYAGEDEAKPIRKLLEDPRCFKGDSIKMMKLALDRLRADLDATIAEERTAAKATIEELRSKLEALPEFSRVGEADRRAILAEVGAVLMPIENASLIAIARERAATFRMSAYPRLLSQVAALAATPTEFPDVGPTGRRGLDDPQPPPPIPLVDIRYTSRESINVPFGKPYLADEADVDAYLVSMREALLTAIRDGNRISV